MVCLAIFYTAPFRHILAGLACLGMILAHAMRQVLSITIIEMTVQQARAADEECPSSGKVTESSIDKVKKIEWTEVQQALVLMGFYFGYSVSLLGVGPLISKFGARWPIVIGMTISAVTTGVIPFVADIHWLVVMAVRVLTGVGQAVLLPGVSALLTFWVPLEARPVWAAVIYAGSPLGTFFGIYMSAIAMIWFENWHYPYYMWALATIPWLIYVLIYIYSYPETHPRLAAQGSSYQHADFIKSDFEEGIKLQLKFGNQIFAAFAHTYLVFTLATYLPKYFNSMMNYNMEDNSIYSATPFAAMYFTGIAFRIIFQWFADKKNINPELLRLIYISISNLASGAVLVGAFFVPCSAKYVILGLIHLAACMEGLYYGGLNILDMSMRHSGFVTSIVIGFASTSGIVAIGVIAKFVETNSTREWQIVAVILFVVKLLMWILDIVFSIAKMCFLQKADQSDRKWHQTVPQQEHQAKIDAAHAAKEELKEKQRGKN